MRPFGNANKTHHTSGQPAPGSSHNRTPSSSYVSTLSNALNISTPTSSKKPSNADTPLSNKRFPTSADPAGLQLKQNQACVRDIQALRTPTPRKDARQLSRDLSLSGNEAFRSPTTPVSPWQASLRSPATAEALPAHGSHAHPAPTGRMRYDQWWMSGTSSGRTPDIFTTHSSTVPSAAIVTSLPSNNQSSHYLARGPAGQNISSNTIPVTLNGARSQATGVQSEAFVNYRELPIGTSRVGDHRKSPGPGELSAQCTVSPTSISFMSPVPFAPTLDASTMGDAFFSSMFEQETPSLSTNLLPSNDLTEYLSFPGGAGTTNSARPGSSFHLTHALGHGHGFVAANEPALSYSHDGPAFVCAQPTSSDQNNERSASQDVSHDTVGFQNSSESSGLVMSDLPESKSRDAAPKKQERLAGLGLDLNANAAFERIEVLASPAQGASRPTMLVDEMGRWRLVPLRYESMSHAQGSRTRRERLTIQESSTASFSTGTEASYTSNSNSSTWDSSFGEATSPINRHVSALPDSALVDTPASSIGQNSSRYTHSAKVADQARPASDPDACNAAPEIYMPDLSEFGQSISIEQMAEERWRTWPRNRDSAISRGHPFVSAQPVSPIAVPHLTTSDPRSSFDSLSVSTSSTRSRLMAEPYNKNKGLRSGRPSSSASTSSRSSIGNAAALESQPTSGTTGPTRPRSHIATGSFRMKASSRSSSSGGAETNAVSNERVSATALALRSARGTSQGAPAQAGSSAMKLTRSIDSITPSAPTMSSPTNFWHSVALQRASKSSDGLNPVTQRPRSMLITSPRSDLAGQLGNGATRPSKARVGFNEVSEALNTLRTFLKQKDSNSGTDGHDAAPSRSTENDLQSCFASKPGRTLRRTKGVLPPRGIFSPVGEFGTLPTAASAATNESTREMDSSTADQRRLKALSSPGYASLSSGSTSNRQDDRLAVLEDLSERVLRLKAETELEKERHAAASMPPPPTRRGGSMSQQMHKTASISPKTRREMHDEYLRRRTSGS